MLESPCGESSHANAKQRLFLKQLQIFTSFVAENESGNIWAPFKGDVQQLCLLICGALIRVCLPLRGLFPFLH